MTQQRSNLYRRLPRWRSRKWAARSPRSSATGDGGYPVAQDNDAERLVRAVLSIQRALAELNRKNEGAHKPALAARIAIDTGPSVLDAGGK